jgi:hypothetical protein
MSTKFRAFVEEEQLIVEHKTTPCPPDPPKTTLGYWIYLAIFFAAFVVGVHGLVTSEAEGRTVFHAVKPFITDCRKCRTTSVIDTGTSTSGGGALVRQDVVCRGCRVEFRQDRCVEPAPPPPPSLPGPVNR